MLYRKPLGCWSRSLLDLFLHWFRLIVPSRTHPLHCILCRFLEDRGTTTLQGFHASRNVLRIQRRFLGMGLLNPLLLLIWRDFTALRTPVPKFLLVNTVERSTPHHNHTIHLAVYSNLMFLPRSVTVYCCTPWKPRIRTRPVQCS